MRALALALLLAACGARTEVILGLATDLDVPQRIDEIRLTVAEGGTRIVDERWALSGAPGALHNLPASYALYTSGREPRVLVELTGFKVGAEVVTRRAELQLVEGRTLFYRLGLTEACIDKLDCGDRQSCVEGACVERELDARRFPDYDEALVASVSCTSGFTAYKDTATKADLPLAPGAEACPIERCFEGTCLAPVVGDNTTRTVQGSAIVTYVTSGALVQRGLDLSGVAPTALILEDDGTYSSYFGAALSDGTFEIPNVPSGRYLLQIGQSYESMTSSYVDLGYVALGDPDAPAAAPDQELRYTLDTDFPWTAGSSIEAFAPDVDMWWFGEGSGAVPTDTSIKGSILATEATTRTPRSLDGRKLTWVQVRSQVTPDGLPFSAAVAKHEATVTPGQISVAARMTPLVEQAFSLPLDMLAWKTALGYDAGVATALHPQALAEPGIAIRLGGAAAGAPYGLVGPSPTYLAASLPFTLPNGPSPNFLYGVPTFGDRWVTMLSTSVHAAVSVQHPAAATPATVFARLRSDQLLLGAAAIAPQLGPVGAPAINGRDLFAPQTGVGTRPVVDWVPPALGRPNNYVVRVLRVGQAQGDPTQTRVSLVATLSTPTPQLVFPPGILVEGELYMLSINAGYVASPATPNRLRFPSPQSSIVTATFTP